MRDYTEVLTESIFSKKKSKELNEWIFMTRCFRQAVC